MLINLLAAIALLVWGTHIVRTGIMRVYGAKLRNVLGVSMQKKPLAFLAGIGVTVLVQSSNATTMLMSSFVSKSLVKLAPALVIVLGADVGTSLMARVLTFDLSWLSPILILVGVCLFLSRKQTRLGQVGRTLLGLGVILLSLQMIVQAAQPITQAAGLKVVFSSLTGDIFMDTLIGAIMAIISYSSLAAVLITAKLVASEVISLPIALTLVVGANLGSGLIAVLNNGGSGTESKRLVLGSLIFKSIGAILILPFIPWLGRVLDQKTIALAEIVIFFHVVYNLLRCILLLPCTTWMATLCQRIIPESVENDLQLSPRFLDSALIDTPTLALANSARETLRMGDRVEKLLKQLNQVIQSGQVEKKLILNLGEENEILYTAIKHYLVQLQHDTLSREEANRWAEIFEMVMNLQESSQLLTRIIPEVKIAYATPLHTFSDAEAKDCHQLVSRLINNLQLGMTVFISQELLGAQRLHRGKHRFRVLNHRYAFAHLERLQQQTLEKSTLYLSLLGDLRRLNALFCSGAYRVLDTE